MSRYHLARAFAKAFGVAPHRYQIHVRIEKAHKLLAAGMCPASVAGGLARQGFVNAWERADGVPKWPSTALL